MDGVDDDNVLRIKAAVDVVVDGCQRCGNYVFNIFSLLSLLSGSALLYWLSIILMELLITNDFLQSRLNVARAV